LPAPSSSGGAQVQPTLRPRVSPPQAQLPSLHSFLQSLEQPPPPALTHYPQQPHQLHQLTQHHPRL
jgi:hypothetical protein